VRQNTQRPGKDGADPEKCLQKKGTRTVARLFVSHERPQTKTMHYVQIIHNWLSYGSIETLRADKISAPTTTITWTS
jgi:hypothetical protein